MSETAEETKSGTTWEEIAREAIAELSETEEGAAEAEEALPTRKDDTEPVEDVPEVEEAAAEGEEIEETAETEEFSLSKEDQKALASNPELAQLHENLKRWRAKLTQEAQAFAESRRQRDEDPLLRSLREDPKGTLLRLMGEAGIAPSVAPAEEPKDQPGTLAEELRKELPEDVDFLVEPLTKFVSRAVEARLEAELERRMKPFQDTREQLLSREAQTKLDAAQAQFAQKHPDWKKHEPKMLEYARKLTRGVDGKPLVPDMEPLEFLEVLHGLATAGHKDAAKAKELVERQTRAVRSSESARGGISPKEVEDKPLERGASWDDCVKEAKREVEQE